MQVHHAKLPSGPSPPRDASTEAFLLGTVDFAACLALQQRLVYETSGHRDGQITLLVCEHSPTITIGREGSRAHVHFDPRELVSRRLELRWVNRGGGCLVHSPGQLAVYPIVPLEWHAFTVGDYLDRLQAGIALALADAGFHGQTIEGRYGLWGRSGQVAALATAVKSWVSYFGAYINVAPAMELVRRVQTDPTGGTPASSLAIERQQPVRMPAVREALVRRLSEAFGCHRYHVYAGHPLLAAPQGALREPAARVG